MPIEPRARLSERASAGACEARDLLSEQPVVREPGCERLEVDLQGRGPVGPERGICSRPVVIALADHLAPCGNARVRDARAVVAEAVPLSDEPTRIGPVL